MKTRTGPIAKTGDALRFMTVALEHEWAVSFEYLVHAYSMPKGKYFYQDPVMKHRLDVRAERALVVHYERLTALVTDEDVRSQLRVQLALKREHVFTQERLLTNALSLPALK